MNSQTNERHIFVVSVVLYQDYRRRYPIFSAHEHVCGYSHSLEGAENLMHNAIAISKDCRDPVYCFYIREKSMEKCFHDSFGEGRLSERVYDADGCILDKRLICWNEEFYGRDPEEIRFVCGDIVEAYDAYNHRVTLGFIMELPSTKEEILECNAYFATLDEPLIGEHYHDATDDCYMFMIDDNGKNHEHWDALYVFKPHFPIPRATAERLKRQYRRYLEKYADRYFHKPMTDDERAWLKAHNMEIDDHYSEKP